MVCVAEISDAVGQGYCQGGFSADFTTVKSSSSSPQLYSSPFSLFCMYSAQPCVLQDGKVVLGGPGSYFWQGMPPPLRSQAESFKKEFSLMSGRLALRPQVRSSPQPRRTSSGPTIRATSCSLWPTRSRPSRSGLIMMTATRVRRTHPAFTDHPAGEFPAHQP